MRSESKDLLAKPLLLMETPKIFSPDLFLHAAAVSGYLEGGFDYFPPSAHGLYPKR